MRDVDYGKQIAEEMRMEAFVDSFPRVTGNTVEILSQGESPDFVAMINDREIGIEITQIRAHTPDEYMEEVIRLVGKKEDIYERLGVFDRSTMLLCYGEYPPLFDMRRFLDFSPSQIDLSESKFSEIWLIDLSDEYYSAQDPRKPADFYCLSLADRRGFTRLKEHENRSGKGSLTVGLERQQGFTRECGEMPPRALRRQEYRPALSRWALELRRSDHRTSIDRAALHRRLRVAFQRHCRSDAFDPIWMLAARAAALHRSARPAMLALAKTLN